MSMSDIRRAINDCMSGHAYCTIAQMRHMGAGKGHEIDVTVNFGGKAASSTIGVKPGHNPNDAAREWAQAWKEKNGIK